MARVWPDSAQESLARIGSRFLARIDAEEPQFLVEIELGQDELTEIFRLASDARLQILNGSAVACLALAAVHAAAQADQDDQGFRALFYHRLGRDLDAREWEQHFGAPIALFLQDHFAIDLPKEGPNRYVGSIYRHAGIPVKARSSFCRMLAALIQNGFAFTRADFDLAVENLTSPVTKQFLRSQAGYDFARNTAYIVERLIFNRLPYEELQSMPAYRRSICEGVLELLRGSPGCESWATVSYPAPVIALDRANSRLVLRFDERGVRARAYRTPSGLVLYSTVSMSRSSPAQYRILPGLDYQTVDPWWIPGRSAEALFSFGDGILVDSSRPVRPGMYYLVTSRPEGLPDGIVKERGPYLDDGGFNPTGDVYQIIAVDLPVNYELGLAIKTRRTAATPRFAFGATDTRELGANVFVEQPPPLQFINWTAECDTRYWMWLSDGSEVNLVKPPPDHSSLELRVRGPGFYSIWIEPKRGGPMIYRLNFSVLPRGTSFQFSRECFAYNAPANILVQIPRGWEFLPGISSRELAPGHWEVPSETRVLDASLRYSSMTIPISLRIPRALLHVGYSRENYAILWREELKRDLPVLVEGLANKRCRILLEGESASFSVCDLGDLPASGTAHATVDHFIDALTICNFSASRFALHVGQTKVPTDLFFASSDAIARSLQNDSADTLIFELPKIGNILSEAKRLLHNRADEISWSSDIEAPPPLHSLLCSLAIMAAELDGSGLREPFESYERFAFEVFRTVATWTKRAKAALRTLGDEERVLAEFPEAVLAVLPAVRWQNYLYSSFRQLDDNWRIAPLLSDWRYRVMNRDLDVETGLISRPGGRDLMDAARHYSDSFSRLRQHRTRELNRVIADVRRLRADPECDALVSLLALVLLQLAYYRSERLSDANEVALALPQFPPALKRLQSLMIALGAHCSDQRLLPVEECGPGFADVSTRFEDAELEQQLDAGRL